MGGVVVVGGGQSGAQIVEDLLGSEKTVYFSISKAARVPRNYRGRDFMDWWVDMGLWDVRGDEVDDPAVLAATNPLVSGVGMLGHSMSYQQLARSGARLMGRLQDVENGKLVTDDRVLEYIRHADEFSKAQKDKIDDFITVNDLEAKDAVVDAGDVGLEVGESVDFLTELDLEKAHIKTVIWSTGFTGDFSWVGLPGIDSAGRPIHRNGVSPVAGLYFIGFPWLSTRKSGIVFGIDDDARHISSQIRAAAAGK
jgi:putative flavoprotein involved in K+ transport